MGSAMKQDVIDLAVSIADEATRADIELSCECEKRPEGGWWYDTSTAVEHDQPDVEKAMRYLELRGLLIRKDGAAHVVSFLASSDARECL